MTSDAEAPVLLAERYELGPIIGGGGMATVRAAWDTRLQRHVAVKTLHAHLAADGAMRRRFEDEGRMAARLAHPNVVQVYDSGEADGVPYLVMELVDGPTLAQRIAAGPLPPEEARDIALGIAHALAVAHDQGIVHRDIKPANVLLVDGIAKVADFGIARAVEGLDRDTTTVILGTPAYVAPEYLAGQPATPRSDVYAAGVVLAEMLTGVRRRDADTQVDVPGPFGDIVTRATSPDPDRRPPDGAALVASLDDLGDTQGDAAQADTADVSGAPTIAIPLAAAPDPDGTVAIAPPPRSESTRTLPSPSRPARPRRDDQSRRLSPLAVAALGMLLVVALALAVGALAGDGGVESPPATTTTTTTTSPPPTTTVRAAAGPAEKAPKPATHEKAAGKGGKD
jgi:serine/threonine-protein kinase